MFKSRLTEDSRILGSISSDVSECLINLFQHWFGRNIEPLPDIISPLHSMCRDSYFTEKNNLTNCYLRIYVSSSNCCSHSSQE